MKSLFIYSALIGLLFFITVNFYAQKDNQPSNAKLKNTRTEMQRILIDKFIVPQNARKEFLERMRLNQFFIKSLPGLVEFTTYEETEAGDEISYVTVAVWENATALDNAKKAVLAEFQKQGFVPSEMFKRLGIKIDRAIYTKMDK